MANTKVTTPIIYYGGKTGIVNHILPLIPRHNVYTEVFFGGGVVFWAKDAAPNETINDRLDIVVNFYRELRLHYRRLKKLVDATLIGRTIHYEALGMIRQHIAGRRVNPTQLAWAFWVCSNFAYSNKIGGGYKYSNDSHTSVPRTLTNHKRRFTEHLVARIENAYIENQDGLDVLQSRNVPAAFHYLDPPYPGADQGHYFRLRKEAKEYEWEEFERLLDWLAKECKGKFLLSNYNSELLDSYVTRHGWYKQSITHRIGGKKESNFNRSREQKTEVLIRNYTTTCGTLKLFTNGTNQLTHNP